MATVQINRSLASALVRQGTKNPRCVGAKGKQQKSGRKQATDQKRVAPIPKQPQKPRTKCSVRRAKGTGGQNRTNSKNKIKRCGAQQSPFAASLVKRLSKKEKVECLKHLVKNLHGK